MQLSGSTARPPVGVVFDGDIGNRIDGVLALAILYGFDSKLDARVVSVSVSKANLKAAALCDAIMRFYISGGTGQLPPFSRTLPVGFADDGKTPEDTKLLTALSKQDAQGKPVYPHGIRSLNDTAECSALIRNALTAQHDQNAIVVLAGPATNLAKVLTVPGAKEVIQRKARYLVMTGGAFPSGDPEFNIATDVAAAKKVLAEWPTPIIACGKEVGEGLRYPGSSIESDFAWTTTHPLVEAYRAYQPMPYDAPAWDAASVVYAVRPNENYFKLSEPGLIRVRDDGGTEFTPAANGKHRHLVPDPSQKERLIKVFTEMASTKPVVRRPRIPQVQQEAKPPEAPKPSDPKPPSSNR